MDAEGRAMQEQLPRGLGEGKSKYAECLFNSPLPSPMFPGCPARNPAGALERPNPLPADLSIRRGSKLSAICGIFGFAE